MNDARPVPRSAGTLSDAAPSPGPDRGRLAAELRVSWWYSASSLAMLIIVANSLPLVPALPGGQAGTARAILLAVLCVTSAGVQLAFVGGMRDGMGRGLPNVPVATAMAVTGVAVLGIAAPLQWSSLPLVTAAGLFACQLPHAGRWGAWAAAAAAVVVEYAAIPADSDRGIGSFILHVFYPAMTMATAWAWDVLRRVNEARTAEGRLAVARERLRFAADLHDIQGHTLQVIALKSELAERLLPDADPDPDSPTIGSPAAPDPARVAAARAQIAEVRQLAADALADTRELVQGYRAPELEEELGNAREVLAAAGFTCRLDARELPVDAATRDVFGRVLREAATNVLRHAAPGPVDVAVAGGPETWTLRVGNALAGAGASESAPADGSGLAGLRERLDAAGGELTVLSDGAAGRFTLTATMPDTTTDQGEPR